MINQSLVVLGDQSNRIDLRGEWKNPEVGLLYTFSTEKYFSIR